MKSAVAAVDRLTVTFSALRHGPLRRLLVLPATTAACATALLAPLGASGSGMTPARWQTYCPDAEPLVAGTAWHNHWLAPGVKLAEGQATDHDGTVDMHVLSVDTSKTWLHFRPLMHKVAQRSPLSDLAQGYSNMVAATNTGFFDFRSGAPTGPVIANGVPVTAASRHQTVVGVNTKGHLQAGRVWLKGTFVDGAVSRRIEGFNVQDPPTGLAVYTQKWGDYRVPLGWNSASRFVVGGKLTSKAGQFTTVPNGGYLVVANGSKAVAFLSGLKVGDTVSSKVETRTRATVPFRLGLGVGLQIVQKPGVVRTDLTCRASYPMPARTAVGFADHGTRLVIAVVADHPGTDLHGLDEKQMSGLMVQLGVWRAWAFDGSGSSEMLAKMPHKSGLSLRNYPADGSERPMPVGFAVFSSR